jgi:hypothetical protein
VGQRLQRTAKAPLRALGCLGHTSDLAFRAGEKRHQQVRFMEGIGAQNQGFRLPGHIRSKDGAIIADSSPSLLCLPFDWHFV